MKQIKTVISHKAAEFDKQVNSALLEGWVLLKRRLVCGPDSGYYYAELEKEIITETERCCENCKHYEDPVDIDPCLNCHDGVLEGWEAVE